MAQRNTQQTIDWYLGHQTKAALGFDPDGQCLKVCRSARNIGAKFPSALAAQVSTPQSKRIYDLKHIKPGMVMYYDDPRDDNPYGHIVTVSAVAKVVNSLDDIIVWTNSVKANTLVRVRGDYFKKHWGDDFQFAATWLNGVDLLLPKPPKPTGGATKHKLPVLQKIIAELDDMIEYHTGVGNTRIVTALKRDRVELIQTANQFK